MRKIKNLFYFFTVTVLMLIFCVTVSAQGTKFTSGPFACTVSDGEITITGYNDSIESNLVIPEEIDGYPVVRIGNYAFSNCRIITDVTIGSNVKYIGRYAFNCPALKNVYVKDIKSWFYTCLYSNKLGNSYLWHPMEYAENFFVGEKLLVDIVIDEDIKIIPDYAFYNNKSIKTLTLHSGVRSISTTAFMLSNRLEGIYVPDIKTWLNVGSDCYMTGFNNLYVNGELLTDAVIPEGVTELKSYTFRDLKNLRSVTFSKDLKKINRNCFEGCVNLENVYVDKIETWLKMEFYPEGSNPLCFAENLYVGPELLTDLVIPQGITDVAKYVFKGYGKLKSVTFPDTLKKIGEDAFDECEFLESVYAPSVEYWLSVDFEQAGSNPLSNGARLYVGNEFLESLTVPEEVDQIKKYAFSGYSFLKSLYITGNPVKFCAQAFDSCIGMKIYAETVEDWLKMSVDMSFKPTECNPMEYGAVLYIGDKPVEEIVVPEDVEEIPVLAFQNCKSLKKITVSATTEIGTNAFRESGLREVVIGDFAQKTEATLDILSDTFRDCVDLEKVTFGYGVKSIANGNFSNRTNLKEVTFSQGIEYIGEKTFYNTAISSVTIPSTVKYVGESAFACCENLVYVTLGDKTGQDAVMEIDDRAFENCPGIETVTFNSGVKSMYTDVFLGSSDIKDVYVNDLAAYLKIYIPSSLAFGQFTNPVNQAENLYIDGVIARNVVIPEGVTSICSYAFARCETLETVEFPSTLLSIDESAFMCCTNLNDFELPEKLERIDDCAFWGCSSITKVIIGKNIKVLDAWAFSNCKSLQVVYFYPESLDMGESIFSDSENIKVLMYTGNKTEWDALISQNRASGLEKFTVFYSYRPESMYAPEIFEAESTSDSINLTWSKINGVTGYRIYVKNPNGWKSVKTLSKNSHKFTGLKPGIKYTFAVKAYINTGALVLWSPEYATLDTATASVKPSKVTAQQNTSAIKLDWSSCPGATGYRIYYKTAGGWKVCVSTTSSTTYTFKNLKAGAKYTFAIRPYIKNGSSVIWSSYAEFTTSTRPEAVAAKVKASSKGSVNLSWNYVNGADGYQIWYKSGDGSYKLYKIVGKIQSTTVTNLKAGKYTFAVRAGIKTSGGNIFGGYNNYTVTVK